MRKATPKQIAHVWALARERGMDAGQLHEVAQRESLKTLSVTEASILIDALKRNVAPDYSKPPRGYHKPPETTRPPRLPKGVARLPTEAQVFKWSAMLDTLADIGERNRQLRIRLDKRRQGDDTPVTDVRVIKWLSQRHYKTHGGPMHKILTSDDAKEGIELLKAVIAKSKAANQRLTELSRQRSAAHACAT